MQPLWQQARHMDSSTNYSPYVHGQTYLPMLILQREGGTMGGRTVQQNVTIEGISRGDDECRCDVCGSTKDVAQIIGTMEGPDPEMGGLANVVYICTYCMARGIQAVTGFRAVRVLDSWYRMREAHPSIKAGNVHHWTAEEDLVG